MTEDLKKSYKELEHKLCGQLGNLAKDLPARPNVSILEEIEATASALLAVSNINEFYKNR
jgi:hypothetical protein